MQLPPVPPIHVTVVAPEHPWYAQWDFWVSIGTMLLAMMSGWLAWETRRMRQGSDKAMGELAKHAENAAVASKESADAARRSTDALNAQAGVMAKALEVAERSAIASEKSANAAGESATATKALAEVGQRAWISVSEVTATTGSTRGYPKGTQDDVVQVVLTIRNGGNSPALDFASSLWLELLECAPIEIDTTALNSASTGVVGPHEPVQMKRHHKELTAEQWTAIANGTQILLLYGVCRYKDFFGAIHFTRWCYRYISDTQQFATYISDFNTMD